MMELWRKLAFPVRRAWCSVSTRFKPRKNGSGLLKLRQDIQTCGCEDVQIMWEILVRSDELNRAGKRSNKWFWRSFRWTAAGKQPPDSAAAAACGK